MYARNSSAKAINPLFTITSRQAIEEQLSVLDLLRGIWEIQRN
jgi:hypothetical protein